LNLNDFIRKSSQIPLRILKRYKYHHVYIEDLSKSISQKKKITKDKKEHKTDVASFSL